MLWLEDLKHAIRTTDETDFWVFFCVGVVLAGMAFWGAFRNFRRARIIEDTPTAKIRSAPQGYVEIVGSGELMEGEPIVAPLTQQICTWYRYSISKHVRSGKSSHWKVIEQDTSDELFLLRDETGDCVVDPEGAEVIPTTTQTWLGHSPTPTRRPKGRKSNSVTIGSGRYRYKEERMFPGDPLYALGRFRTMGGGADLPSNREEISATLRAWKQDHGTMLQRFDQDGDGQINMEEWEAARKAAQQEVLAARNQRLSEPGVDMMLRPEEPRQPYILAAKAQDSLARRYRWFAGGSAAGFLLLGSMATWAVSIRLVGG